VLQTPKLAAALAAVAVASTTALSLSPSAAADPAIPLDPGQLPGLSAMQSLSPVVQQAALNPGSASQLLMAAASALAGNATTPADSAAMAHAVSSFVSDPAAAPAPSPQAMTTIHGSHPLQTPGIGNAPAAEHVPAPGAIPGTDAHLPLGIDPAHVVGPPPDAAPPPATAPAPAAVPVSNPTPGGDPAPAPMYSPDSPPTQEFMYPSISNGCLNDGGNVIATALSVAGPAKIPAPGPGPGQTAYVFTAMGTPAPAAEQKLPLNVTWVNLTSGKSGTATLKPNPAINPQGPTTLVAIADTGSGSIMSTIFGQVTTVDKQCTFMPTIGSTVVP
jgi:hypothetical protein